MAPDPGILSSIFNNRGYSPTHIIVSDGSTIHITATGHATLSHTPYYSLHLDLSFTSKIQHP